MSDGYEKFEPGAAQFGNFISYYNFNPPQERIKILPTGFWRSFPEHRGAVLCLDIGCNTGDLTRALYDFLSQNLDGRTLNFLGIDIDPILIQRATESNSIPAIEFRCSDASDLNSDAVIEDFLSSRSRDRFDVAFLFSVTMWVHLNRGDDGLRGFLSSVAKKTNLLIVEPQPWKCYRTAARRMKRLEREPFPFWDKLEIRQSVEHDIEDHLRRECGFEKCYETERTSWGRKVVFFRRRDL